MNDGVVSRLCFVMDLILLFYRRKVNITTWTETHRIMFYCL